MIDERTAGYLIARLDRSRHRAAMVDARRRSWLETSSIVAWNGIELTRFRPGAAVDELKAIATSLAEDGSAPDPLGMMTARSRSARFLTELGARFDAEIEVDEPGFDEALAKAARGDDDDGAPARVGGERALAHPNLTVEELVRVARNQAGPIKVDDLAAVILIAKAVARLPGGLSNVLEALSAPRPIVTVISPVSGFADALRHLLITGVMVPGPMLDLQLADTRFHGAMAKTRSSFRPVVIELQASDNDTARRRSISAAEVAAAFQTEQPILVQAPSLDALPERVRDASTLTLETGPIDAELVSRMIVVLRGEAPSVAVDDAAFGALGFVDLAIAMRPGIGADAIAEALQRYALDAGRSHKPAGRRERQDDARAGAQRSAKRETYTTILPPSDDPKAPRVETLAGFGAALDWAMDLKQDIQDWKAGTLDWNAMSPRLLLSGQPGTGKTVWVKALGNSLGLPVLATSAATWLAAGHLDDVLNAIDRAFADARGHAPCILFVDEVDGIGRRDRPSRDYDDYWTSVVNKVLELVDGAIRTEGVVVIGATNRPDALDAALRRSGRLETHIAIAKPDQTTLAAILAHHLGDDLAGVIKSAPSEALSETGQAGSGPAGRPRRGEGGEAAGVLTQHPGDADAVFAYQEPSR